MGAHDKGVTRTVRRGAEHVDQYTAGPGERQNDHDDRQEIGGLLGRVDGGRFHDDRLQRGLAEKDQSPDQGDDLERPPELCVAPHFGKCSPSLCVLAHGLQREPIHHRLFGEKRDKADRAQYHRRYDSVQQVEAGAAACKPHHRAESDTRENQRAEGIETMVPEDRAPHPQGGKHSTQNKGENRRESTERAP